MVTTATTRALLVVFAPHEVSERRLIQVLDATSARMTQFTGSLALAWGLLAVVLIAGTVLVGRQLRRSVRNGRRPGDRPRAA